MKITTYYDPTPIPLRCFDWRAYYDPEGPIGYGRTELEALADLMEQTEEMESEKWDKLFPPPAKGGVYMDAAVARELPESPK